MLKTWLTCTDRTTTTYSRFRVIDVRPCCAVSDAVTKYLADALVFSRFGADYLSEIADSLERV